jgi:hypothetical protein
MDRIHLAQDRDKLPTALMQWFNLHFHFFPAFWMIKKNGLRAVETLIEFPILIQTNILAKRL